MENISNSIIVTIDKLFPDVHDNDIRPEYLAHLAQQLINFIGKNAARTLKDVDNGNSLISDSQLSYEEIYGSLYIIYKNLGLNVEKFMIILSDLLPSI